MSEATDLDMSLREAAESLGVHYMTAYRYVRLGQLPARKEGASWVVSQADLEIFLADTAAPESSRRPPADWAARFESRILAGDLTGAWMVVESALTSGMTPADVYLSVVGPALEGVGSRWESGEIGVAGEHLATGVAQRIIGRLSHRMTRRGRSRGSVVLGTGPNELHFLPVTMVADLMRGSGYDVVDLGCNLPVASFVAAASGADRLMALGVSSTTPGQGSDVAETVAALRAALPDVPIILGGSAIGGVDEVDELGGDHYAPDATAAIEVLARL